MDKITILTKFLFQIYFLFLRVQVFVLLQRKGDEEILYFDIYSQSYKGTPLWYTGSNWLLSSIMEDNNN